MEKKKLKYILRDFLLALRYIYLLPKTVYREPINSAYFRLYPEIYGNSNNKNGLDFPIPTISGYLYGVLRNNKKRLVDDKKELEIIKMNHELNSSVSNNNIEYYFINGIMTDTYTLRKNLLALSYCLGDPVVGLYNPTHGFTVDLLECIRGRSLDEPSDIALKIKDFLKKRLLETRDSEKRIVVFAHSQGGIIGTNAINLLEKEISDNDLSKLSFITFGSAADDIVHSKKVYCEHFGNTGDFVARIGIINTLKKPVAYNKLYERDFKGHLLNMHYLENFCLYPVKDSLYYRLTKKERLDNIKQGKVQLTPYKL
jgi:hypothetical protein